MALKVRDVISAVEEKAPSESAEVWDNPGLSVGSPEEEVKGILVSLDVTLKVIEEAKEKGCNLIVAHHPLLFRKPESVTDENLTGRKIMNAVKNGINIYSAHTNLDKMENGMADKLMELLGFSQWYGFSEDGMPYGRMAEIENGIVFSDFIKTLKEKLECSHLRFHDSGRKLKKIAAVNGSGSDFIDFFMEKGADVLLTGDMTYHNMSDAAENHLSVIDPGHFFTEKRPFEMVMEEILTPLLVSEEIPLKYSEQQNDPFSFI